MGINNKYIFQLTATSSLSECPLLRQKSTYSEIFLHCKYIADMRCQGNGQLYFSMYARGMSVLGTKFSISLLYPIRFQESLRTITQSLRVVLNSITCIWT